MRVAVTGADGFIGRNLCLRLEEIVGIQLVRLTHDSSADLVGALAEVDALVHLAGVNRPKLETEFVCGNVEYTQAILKAIEALGRPIKVVLSSSIQAEYDNPYGRSKRQAELLLVPFCAATGSSASIFRLPNVFGKWCRPNYNSAIATFCFNVANRLPITIHDRNSSLELVYIDDVVDAIVSSLLEANSGVCFATVPVSYQTTVGEVADHIVRFGMQRQDISIGRVGHGLERALHATFLSYLSPEDFSYSLPKYVDQRGVFVEMLKTPDSGQFSFFTAHPGVTRGSHYHHTKTEKFLVLAGLARFRFRNVLDSREHEIVVRADDCRVVETVPGWSHDVTNVGENELIVMLWASEVFDRKRPDTKSAKVF